MAEPRSKPKWLNKHPCEACGVGYGECAQGYVHSLMCCKACSHPTRWQPDPYTAEDYAEMGFAPAVIAAQLAPSATTEEPTPS